MKKRMARIACVAFLLALFSQPVFAWWLADYGTCMQSNLTDHGNLWETREAAKDAAWADYNNVSSPYYGNLYRLSASLNEAHNNWWNGVSDSNSIFGSCTGGINLDYNEPDFCANAYSVYNNCLNSYQCEAMEDEDAQALCNEARSTCINGTGIDGRCR